MYLAATLSGGLVAVWVETFADVAVAGATHGASPPAFGTRFLHPYRAETCINANSSTRTFSLMATFRKFNLTA